MIEKAVGPRSRSSTPRAVLLVDGERLRRGSGDQHGDYGDDDQQELSQHATNRGRAMAARLDDRR